MTKDKAFYSWLQGFEIPFYPASSVPDDVIFPYGTYELVTGAWGDGPIPITLKLWYYTTSEAAPNAKVQEISDAIGLGGTMLFYDSGAAIIRRGVPFCQSFKDEVDFMIKLRYININVEYFSPN